jgi:hypothetical protein
MRCGEDYIPQKIGYTTVRRLRITAVVVFMVVCLTAAWHLALEPVLGGPSLPTEATAQGGRYGCPGGWNRVAENAAYRAEPLADALYRCNNGAELIHAESFARYASLAEQKSYNMVMARLDGGWIYVR